LRLIPFALAIAWGLNWPAVKIALSAFPPFPLRMVGLGSGAALLLLLALIQRKPLLPPRRSWRGVLIGGTLAIAVFNLSTALAQLNTSTSRAAVLTFTMPMMSAILSWLVVGERIDRRKGVALALGFIGVIVLAWPVFIGALAAHDERAYKGLVFPLLAAFGWAAGTVYLKRWPVSGDRIAITAWQLLVGAGCGALGAVLAGEHFPDHPIGARRARAVNSHRVGYGDGVLAMVHPERARQRDRCVADDADGTRRRRVVRDGARRRSSQRNRLVRLRLHSGRCSADRARAAAAGSACIGSTPLNSLRVNGVRLH